MTERDTATAGGPAETSRWTWMVVTAAGVLTLAAMRIALVHADMPTILYWEEPYRLTIATEILEGPNLPLAEYQADHYQGGSLAVGLMAVPLVAAFGASFATLKLVPLLFSLATAILWCVLLWRAVGPLAAAFDAWLLALAPPLAQIYQVHAMGSHAESALFTAAGFVLVQRIAAGVASPVLPFLLGLVGGLGLWFCYSAVSGIAAWGLFWLLATPRGSVRRGALPLAAGVLGGLTPWIVYNAAYGFRGLDRLVELLDRSRPAITGSNEPLATRVSALFAVDLPRALGFPETVVGVPGAEAWIYLSLLAIGVVGVSAVAVQAKLRSPRSTTASSAAGEAGVGALISLGVAFHLAAYSVSSFRPDVESGFIAYRFFYPLFPMAAAALAMLLARPRRMLPRVAAVAALLVALGLGVEGTAGLLREHEARPVRPTENGYRLMGLLMQIKHHENLAHAVEMLDRLSGDPRDLAFFGYGWGLQFEYEKYREWSKFAAGLALCPSAADRAAALRGANWAIGERLRASRDQANAGFRPELNRQLLVVLSEFAAHLRALPKD